MMNFSEVDMVVLNNVIEHCCFIICNIVYHFLVASSGEKKYLNVQQLGVPLNPCVYVKTRALPGRFAAGQYPT